MFWRAPGVMPQNSWPIDQAIDRIRSLRVQVLRLACTWARAPRMVCSCTSGDGGELPADGGVPLGGQRVPVDRLVVFAVAAGQVRLVGDEQHLPRVRRPP